MTVIYIYSAKMYFKSRLKEEGCSDSSIEDETTHHKERQHPALWRISILNHLMIKNTNRAVRPLQTQSTEIYLGQHIP